MRPAVASVGWRDHLPNRHSLRRLAAFLFQLSLLAIASSIFPFILRRLILPSSIEASIPLNIVFSTCRDDLHGVCSFPSATLDYESHSIFSPSISYSLAVRLHFADLDQNRHLAMFQNQLAVYSPDGKEMRNYLKSAYLKGPGIIGKAFCLAFFPLYLLGLVCDYSSIDVPLTDLHTESASQFSTKLVYSLHDRYAQVDSAYLVIHANFGLIRHFVYFWPLTFYTLIFVPTFCSLSFLLTLVWALRVAAQNSERREQLNEDTASEGEPTEEIEFNESIPADFENLESENFAPVTNFLNSAMKSDQINPDRGNSTDSNFVRKRR